MPNIVIGVDGSAAALKAVAWGVAEARFRGVPVHLMHSWSFPAATVGADGLPHADIQAAAEKVLSDALASVDTDGLEVTTEICPDLPAQALVRASEGAEMVVVASRGVGGFAGLHIGSTADQVVHHAKCPVVVIPHDR